MQALDRSENGVPDKDIRELILNGDENGLYILLRQFGGPTQEHLERKYASSKPHPDVEQSIVDAAYEVWVNVHRFDPTQGTLGSWFLRRAEWRLRDILRRDGRTALPQVSQRDLVRASLRAQSFEVLSNKQLHLNKQIEEAIQILPSIQQAVLKADLDAGGMADTAQVCKELGISANAVFVARSRGRAALRARRADFWEDEA